MKYKKRFAVAAFLSAMVCVSAAALWFWSGPIGNPRIDVDGGVQFYVYEAGDVVHTGKLNSDSPVVQRLQKFLRDEGGRWHKTILTYAPGICFKSQNSSITLQQREVVVNYADEKGEWRQVAADMPAGAFEDLKKDLSRLP
jgi:hypothetical protein